MPEVDEAIISIHPRYANAILSGEKTVELRRRIPALVSGTRLWIYATRPTAAVIGFVTIQSIAKAHPRTIWQNYREGAGVDHESFKTYFNGAQEGFAISLETAKRVRPITIDQLRAIRRKFHPPQVVTRLTASEAKALRAIAKQTPRQVERRTLDRADGFAS